MSPVEPGPAGSKGGGDGPKTVTRSANLAFAIVTLVAGVAAGMLIYIALDQFVPGILSQPPVAVESSELNESIGYVSTIWELLPFFIVTIAAIGLISRAAFESRGGI